VRAKAIGAVNSKLTKTMDEIRGRMIGYDMEGYGGIWRDMEGYGGIWRDMEGYGGIWRDMEG
jgi:hypothetical protein